MVDQSGQRKILQELKTKIGFFLAGEIYREKDTDPSAVGNYAIKSEK
ncbi:MAG: hypothetical protein IPG89_20770 [Bacteroidetes bacterium]|nr:hypothetical protein [Bacteroidota bacterium]